MDELTLDEIEVLAQSRWVSLSGHDVRGLVAEVRRLTAAVAELSTERARLAAHFLIHASNCDEGAKGCEKIDTLQDEVIRWEASAATWREAAAALGPA